MTEHFQRYSAPDPAAHARDIERFRNAHAEATLEGASLKVIDITADLASLLTTARREAEAREMLVPLQSAVLQHLSSEPAGWFYLSFGTASQYLGLRAEANTMFAEALRLARANTWERLEHFVLGHWGRSLVEEQEFSRARECFVQALELRERLEEHALAVKTRGALEALRELESGSA